MTWPGWASAPCWPERWPTSCRPVSREFFYDRVICPISLRGRWRPPRPSGRWSRKCPVIAVVLGSGLNSLAEGLADSVDDPLCEGPPLPRPHRRRPRGERGRGQARRRRPADAPGAVPLLRGSRPGSGDLSGPGAPVPGSPHLDPDRGHRRDPRGAAAGEPRLPVRSPQPARAPTRCAGCTTSGSGRGSRT